MMFSSFDRCETGNNRKPRFAFREQWRRGKLSGEEEVKPQLVESAAFSNPRMSLKDGISGRG
jgi:hypothetical protein